MQEERRAINILSVQKIDLYENGIKISISQEIRDKFEYTGLSTIDFITSEFYKRTVDVYNFTKEPK